MRNYTLAQYKDKVERLGEKTEESLQGKGGELIRHLTYNSREVREGTLFICKGEKFRKEYLEEAIQKGAVAYISEKAYPMEREVPYILVRDIRKVMPVIADMYFGHPAQEMRLLGIGGTKGKTTTSFYVKAILDAYCRDKGKTPCGILSSIFNFDGRETKVAHNTTPEAVELQQYLQKGREAGMEYLVMEVSSQALKYHRVDTLTFDVGVFLNISEDHISPIEHKDFEDYFSSKKKMFAQTRTAVVHLETDHLPQVLEAARQAEKLVTISSQREADYRASHVEKTETGSRFTVEGPGGYRDVLTLSMPGLFNVDNALAAVAVCRELQIPPQYIRKGLETAKVKGRMEIFRNRERQLVAIVDYAHNKLSFETLFSSMKKEFPDHSITAVFGCTGGKALQRRKELGTVAGRYADLCILTSDEPDFEDPREIAEEVARFVKGEGCPYRIVEDRQEAIRQAICEADPKTLVIVAGKGHEGSMKIKGVYVDYPSDLEIVEKYVR